MTFYGCQIHNGETTYFSGTRNAIAPFLEGEPISCTRLMGLGIDNGQGSTFIRVHPESEFQELEILFGSLRYRYLMSEAEKRIAREKEKEKELEMETRKDSPKKQFRIEFVGRKAGAIGIFQVFTETVNAIDKQDALLKLYDNYEHIHQYRIQELEDSHA